MRRLSLLAVLALAGCGGGSHGHAQTVGAYGTFAATTVAALPGGSARRSSDSGRLPMQFAHAKLAAHAIAATRCPSPRMPFVVARTQPRISRSAADLLRGVVLYVPDEGDPNPLS